MIERLVAASAPAAAVSHERAIVSPSCWAQSGGMSTKQRKIEVLKKVADVELKNWLSGASGIEAGK